MIVSQAAPIAKPLGRCEKTRLSDPTERCSGIAYHRRGGVLCCEYHGFEHGLELLRAERAAEARVAR